MNFYLIHRLSNMQCISGQTIMLEVFTADFGNLVRYIYRNDGFMRKYSTNSQVVTMMKDLDAIDKIMKEKEKEAKSGCSYGKVNCSMIWDL